MVIIEGFFKSESPGEEIKPASNAVGAYNVDMTSHKLSHPIIL